MPAVSRAALLLLLACSLSSARRLKAQGVRVTNSIDRGGRPTSTLGSRVLLQSATKTFGGTDTFIVPRPKAAAVQLGNAASYTLGVWVKTRHGGTIVAKTAKRWVAACKSLFVHSNGVVEFNVAFVGTLVSRKRVNDGRWHHIVLVYNHPSHDLVLFVDGHLAAHKTFDPRPDPSWATLQLGFTTGQFPIGQSYFIGQIADLVYWKRALQTPEIRRIANGVPGGIAEEAKALIRAHIKASAHSCQLPATLLHRCHSAGGCCTGSTCAAVDCPTPPPTPAPTPPPTPNPYALPIAVKKFSGSLRDGAPAPVTQAGLKANPAFAWVSHRRSAPVAVRAHVQHPAALVPHPRQHSTAPPQHQHHVSPKLAADLLDRLGMHLSSTLPPTPVPTPLPSMRATEEDYYGAGMNAGMNDMNDGGREANFPAYKAKLHAKLIRQMSAEKAVAARINHNYVAKEAPNRAWEPATLPTPAPHWRNNYSHTPQTPAPHTLDDYARSIAMRQLPGMLPHVAHVLMVPSPAPTTRAPATTSTDDDTYAGESLQARLTRAAGKV